ncbi:cobalt-precorrin-5B (C(1))-methyltransferase [uncultured Neptuniibacter sp.]|uniref:cobalt-precorrin-5B (C(1))-methyltransferase n=1 Tax=uncultured Neptuniibacter sp. TaxID=502143 RepID=UPI002614E090|nr:cobalt-precorrin-5B (C(1))-methyltransferase [uncultured Neptuniibacter sp.]
MWPESSENQQQQLRSGLTTGCCATACCVAAAQALLAEKQPQKVEVLLPRGQLVELEIIAYQPLQGEQGIRTATIKDAGDDPDVTHGATVFVELRLLPDTGVVFKPAAGVGTVTREGLVLEVGEPAINPVPRQMMMDHLHKAAGVYGYEGGFEVSVGVERGEQIALKTMNPRLGIMGGLSILGTTGIVRPYSCAAYIASIRQGVDVANANGIQHLAATTGSTSEAAIKAQYQLDEMALIEMGDFVGALLKHLRKVPVARLSICGGFGKMTKLANGHMDLNSRSSSIDFQHMALLAEKLGADAPLLEKIRAANTSMEVLQLCQVEDIDLAQAVCTQALLVAEEVVHKTQPQIEIEVWATDRKGNFVGHAQSQPASGES